jgi:3-methyladenine DNA glycosylase AlkD
MLMNPVADCFAEIRIALAAHAGAPTAAIRRVRRSFTQQIKPWPPAQVYRLADLLLYEETTAGRFLAYELIKYHAAARTSLTPARLKKLARTLDSWFAVDMFGCYLAGVAWREGYIDDALIACWARSNDRWWRRAALVCTVPLNHKTQKGRGEAARTLAVCELLLGDRDDMVVKAFSWALRELAKRDELVVARFMERHGDAVAPRVRREVRNKLQERRIPSQSPRGGRHEVA